MWRRYYSVTLDMEKIYGWVFFYNPFNEVWIACPSDNYVEVRNDYLSKHAIRSAEHSTLVSMIIRGDGELKKIKALIK